jgi:hypothetical protein
MSREVKRWKMWVRRLKYILCNQTRMEVVAKAKAGVRIWLDRQVICRMMIGWISFLL